MQNLKPKFRNPDFTHLGTLQSCIRTNDLDLVGDGTHLTYFEMLGNFSFGNNDYEKSVELWTTLLFDFNLQKDCVIHIHPESLHHSLWKKFPIVDDTECLWSDGDIGGYCCEIYWNGIEIGNLVNPLGHSTDVGFGFERLVMVIEGLERVDQSSLFDQTLDPICKDHVRTLNSFWDNGVFPGNKGRHYICRRLIRRILGKVKNVKFDEWLESERVLREKCLMQGKKLWKKHKNKPLEWWWGTCGLSEDDLVLIR